MPRRRTWKLPLSSRQATAFIRAARADNFKTVAFEIRTADGAITRLTATDKPPADDDNEARDASTVAKERIEQMRASSKRGESA
jgi:hypothetical protein